MLKFKIGKKTISNNSSTYFIADIAANHDGSLSKAKELIHMAADSGADAAKFQNFSHVKSNNGNGLKLLDFSSFAFYFLF